MEGYRLIPEKYRFLSNSGLKTIAVAAMLLDHIASTLLYDDMTVLFCFFGRMIGYYEIFRLIGRVAFPIYAFLLVEGFEHTGSRKRYALRLMLFALISEIPWNLEHTGSVFYAGQNVFFTLLLGYFGLCVTEKLNQDKGSMNKTPWLAQLFFLLFLSVILRADFGASGFGFILLLYILRKHPVFRAVTGTCFLPSQWRSGMAFIPIAFYNGRRGFIKSRSLQWLFYAVYPLHLLILYFICAAMGGYA